MKNVLTGLFVGILLGGGVTWNLSHRAAIEDETSVGVVPASGVHHGSNGEVYVTMDASARARAALEFKIVDAVTLPREIKGYGLAMDPTPLAGLVLELVSARAALDAATREYQRLQVLHEQDHNVSTRELEKAEATLQQNRLQAEGAQSKLALALGPALADRSDVADLVHDLVRGQSGLIRVNLPLGERLDALPIAARFATLGFEDRPFEGTFLGLAPSVDPRLPGHGYLFLVESAPPPPNTPVVGWLPQSGNPDTRVVAPSASLLRFQGAVFVYRREDKDTFQRVEVALDYPVENGWLVKGGLRVDDAVVTTGAQQLLSEEFKGESEVEEE